MTKKIISWLAFMSVFSVLLYSCRTDESVREGERADQEKIMAFVKFHEKSTVSRFADEGSYSYPFAEIIENYFYNHPDYAGMFIKDVGTIDLHVASQTFLDGEEKIVLFPILEDKKVTAIIQCTVNADETYVSFKVLKTEVPTDMQDAIRDFQEHYDNKTSEAGREKSIQEVIITVYLPRNWTGSGIDYNPWGSSGSGAGGTMNGGSGIHGSGGSGSGSPSSQNQTPCEKTKNILNNPELQSAITKMKNQAALPVSAQNYGEIGYKFKADGTSSGMISGGKHEVELGPEAGYQGGYHNHPLMGIKMLSPDDIVKLLNFAMAQPNGNIADAFMGMIGAGVDGTEYHYVIQYTGNMQELQQYLYSNNWDLDKLKNDYREMKSLLSINSEYSNNYITLNNKGLEKLFFNTLKSMNLENKINLQRIENNGIIKNIILDSSDKPSANQCPQ